jgi:para-nitrobenzyl esterase
MKQIAFFSVTVLLFLVASQYLHAQAVGCGTGRYETDNMFTVKRTNNILYGNNINVNGANQNLYLNFYEPNGDTASKRPLMIVAFGGSFISGDRNQVDFICQAFTKMGYCCAAIDYRYGFPFPFTVNQITTTLVVVRAMHDMKAAVRFFKKDAATTNTYKIDTGRIILGGVSAGAITAIHAAYLDNDNEIPSYLYNDTTGLSGIEGKSGNAGYSSKVAGVFNFSGTIGDTNWIAPNDAPIISFHETGDNTVPFDTREVRVSGIPTGLIASGSKDIHLRCDNVGTINMLYTYPTNNHTQYLSSDPQVFQKVRDFFFNHVTCKVNPPSVVAKNYLREPAINLYPNPTNGKFIIESLGTNNGSYDISIYDCSGNNIYSMQNISERQFELALQTSPGIYSILIRYPNSNPNAVFRRNIMIH